MYMILQWQKQVWFALCGCPGWRRAHVRSYFIFQLGRGNSISIWPQRRCYAEFNRGVALATDQVTGPYPSAKHQTGLVSAELDSMSS